MISIFKKREGNIVIPFKLSKTTIFNKIVNISDNDLSFPGIIKISPSLIDGAGVDIGWTLTNVSRNLIIMDGVGDAILENMEVGLYSVTYKPILGYATPLVEIKSLRDNQTIEFNAVYQIGDPIGNLFGTIIINMNLVVGGWKIELLDDSDEVILSIPSEGYSNVQQFTQDNLPLGKYRLSVKNLNIAVLSPLEGEYVKMLSVVSPVISWNIVYDNPSQFQSTVNVTIDGDSNPILWKLQPKYRVGDEIVRAGELLNHPIFVSQNGEPWKFAISDEQNIFDNYIMKVNGAVLYKDRAFKEFRYGYIEDELTFTLSGANNINIISADYTNLVIPQLTPTLALLENQTVSGNNAYVTGSTNSWYASISGTVNRYVNKYDQQPFQSNFVQGFRQLHQTVYTAIPIYYNNIFNYGWFNVITNKPAKISLYSLIKVNGVTVEARKIGTYTDSQYFFVDYSILYPVIDITQ